jgi:preprotein translocase subunit YajC
MIGLIIAVCTLSMIVVILGFTTFNLMKKQEKSEDILSGYLDYLDRLSRVIEISEKKIKEVDRAGIFEKDDDVGIIFKSITEIQNILNEFNLRKFN